MRTDEEDSTASAKTEKWQKVWAVLKRPYLVLYRSSNEQEELENVISISTVRVDHSSQLEEVLDVSLAIGLAMPHRKLRFLRHAHSADTHSAYIPL